MKEDKIYFVSQFDNQVHNIYDWEHQFIDVTESNEVYNAYIGKDSGKDGFRVDEEVVLYTIKEIAKFY